MFLHNDIKHQCVNTHILLLFNHCFFVLNSPSLPFFKAKPQCSRSNIYENGLYDNKCMVPSSLIESELSSGDCSVDNWLYYPAVIIFFSFPVPCINFYGVDRLTVAAVSSLMYESPMKGGSVGMAACVGRWGVVVRGSGLPSSSIATAVPSWTLRPFWGSLVLWEMRQARRWNLVKWISGKNWGSGSLLDVVWLCFFL